MTANDSSNLAQADEADETLTKPLGAGIDFADPNSPLARYYLQAGDVWGVFLLCGMLTFTAAYPLWHSDIWGHVQFGEWMLEHGRLPEQEPFCPFADKSVKPIPAAWLTQAAYGELVRLSKFAGRRDNDPERSLMAVVEWLRAFHIAIAAALFTFLWLAFRRGSGSAGWANLTLMIAFLLLIYPLSVQRPQLLGVLLFAILLFVLSRPEVSRGAVIGLPILFAAWVNLHGTFVVGLAFFLLYLVARIAERNWRKRRTPIAGECKERSIERMTVALVLSCLATAFANPEGPMHLVRVVRFAHDHPAVSLFDEWQPLEFSSGPGGHWRFLILWAILLFLWSASRFSKPFLVLFLVPFGLWPLWQVRGSIWWYLVVCWLIATLGPAVTARFELAATIRPSVPSFRKTMLAVSLIVLTVLWLRPTQEVFGGRLRPLEQTVSGATPWRLGLELQATPEQRARWLPEFDAVVRTYPNGRYQGTIFASEAIGDYLQRFAPEANPVLFYTHAHFFSRDYYSSCIQVKLAEGEWRQWLTDHHANLVVVEADLWLALANALRNDPEWQVVAENSDLKRSLVAGSRLFIAVRKRPK